MALTEKTPVLAGITDYLSQDLTEETLFMLQAKEKQIQRIRTIFHRQLSVPLVNMSSTLRAYKTWEMEQGIVLDVESGDLDGVSSIVASAYRRALEGYNARIHLEEQILRQDISESERLQQYMVCGIQDLHFPCVVY